MLLVDLKVYLFKICVNTSIVWNRGVPMLKEYVDG